MLGWKPGMPNSLRPKKFLLHTKIYEGCAKLASKQMRPIIWQVHLCLIERLLAEKIISQEEASILWYDVMGAPAQRKRRGRIKVTGTIVKALDPTPRVESLSDGVRVIRAPGGDEAGVSE